MTDRRRSWRQRTGAGVLALALAGVLGAGSALARPDGHGGRGCGDRGDRLAEKIRALGLNTETQAAVDQVLAKAQETRKAQRDEMRAAKEQMHTLLTQDAPAHDAVMAQADAIGALETEARKQRLETMLPDRHRAVEAARLRHGRAARFRHGPRARLAHGPGDRRARGRSCRRTHLGGARPRARVRELRRGAP
jgi:Spy/CpxP family protein refolding chaperone